MHLQRNKEFGHHKQELGFSDVFISHMANFAIYLFHYLCKCSFYHNFMLIVFSAFIYEFIYCGSVFRQDTQNISLFLDSLMWYSSLYTIVTPF